MGWDRVERWVNEEKNMTVLVAMELFTNVLRNGEIGCIVEAVDFDRLRWLVAKRTWRSRRL